MNFLRKLADMWKGEPSLPDDDIVVFCVDTSISMAQEYRLEIAIKLMCHLTSVVHDTLYGVVDFGTLNQIVHHPTNLHINQYISTLHAKGGTTPTATGLKWALEAVAVGIHQPGARSHHARSRAFKTYPQIVLITDGPPNDEEANNLKSVTESLTKLGCRVICFAIDCEDPRLREITKKTEGMYFNCPTTKVFEKYFLDFLMVKRYLQTWGYHPNIDILAVDNLADYLMTQYHGSYHSPLTHSLAGRPKWTDVPYLHLLLYCVVAIPKGSHSSTARVVELCGTALISSGQDLINGAKDETEAKARREFLVKLSTEYKHKMRDFQKQGQPEKVVAAETRNVASPQTPDRDKKPNHPNKNKLENADGEKILYVYSDDEKQGATKLYDSSEDKKGRTEGQEAKKKKKKSGEKKKKKKKPKQTEDPLQVVAVDDKKEQKPSKREVVEQPPKEEGKKNKKEYLEKRPSFNGAQVTDTAETMGTAMHSGTDMQTITTSLAQPKPAKKKKSGEKKKKPVVSSSSSSDSSSSSSSSDNSSSDSSSGTDSEASSTDSEEEARKKRRANKTKTKKKQESRKKTPTSKKNANRSKSANSTGSSESD